MIQTRLVSCTETPGVSSASLGARLSGEEHIRVVVKLVQASRASFIRDLSRKLVALFVLASSLTARAAEQAATPSPTEPRLHVSRLDLADVRFITPLGNLNPRSGHVLPTDHIYTWTTLAAAVCPCASLPRGVSSLFAARSGTTSRSRSKSTTGSATTLPLCDL